ncbi:MAG: MBL fold metallo-hydrolase [Verrucomicrobia bacterium]|nr:MBL fold metallo-hydrolase [Verrucomicrobiota bacterium]
MTNPTIRFFGVAAYELISSTGRRILVDPFLDENPGSSIKSAQLEPPDLILVSHAAVDHLGDTEILARRTGAPVVCGGEVKAYLTAKGIPPRQIRSTTWGIAVEINGIHVQPVECHHWSQILMPDGTLASGVPMAFIITLAPTVRFYHYGDTAIFSDLKLQAELYKPTIGCVGIANPLEILGRFPMPGQMLTAEMSPREGALAAQWLGLEKVLPCHYIDPNCPEVQEFIAHLAEAKAGGSKVPESIVLKPGEIIEAS